MADRLPSSQRGNEKMPKLLACLTLRCEEMFLLWCAYILRVFTTSARSAASAYGNTVCSALQNVVSERLLENAGLPAQLQKCVGQKSVGVVEIVP